LDKPADITVEGFGWRMVKDLQVVGAIWNVNKEALKSPGFEVMQNSAGDWLVSYNPQRNGLDASS
jgi:hypothetical protein